MRPSPVTLGDKYDLEMDRIFMSGTQALVRLVLMQRELDRRAGLDTAGYVSGYRGSPLGGLDQQFWRAGSVLADNDIVFQAGLNEDLAATAIWGTQKAGLMGEGRHDGVFGMWYGKGPGVDRSGDALRHANFAGTSKYGGVLAVMGDDHTCESSTTAHQSEFAFVDAMMPILNPAGVQEILDFGLYGWALSRFAGVWVGLKCIKDNVESTASVRGTLERPSLILPEFEMPPGGLNIATGRTPLQQEALLHNYKKPAALAFLRENALDRIVWRGGPGAWIGIASLGKSWLDTLQALDLLGIDEVRAADLGLRLYKIAAPWPLEPEGTNRFAEGLETLIVVEEKRSLVETQIKEQLYGRAHAPAVVGKKDEADQVLFASHGALDANDIAIGIGRRILARRSDERLQARLEALEQAQAGLRATGDVALRVPYFCSGCPHNISTHVPEGSIAHGGIGCHYMVLWMDRENFSYTHMGAEGADWIGEAPFSKRDHIFQNMGDGTYNHSGYLAIRAAAAAGVNITFKILYNDAVAMTGGQRNDGDLSVDAIARQVVAEGARRLAVVSDDPGRYPSGLAWPRTTTFHHRSELEAVQKDLREVGGLSVLIYDQTCAAEKRRRRKRGLEAEPDARVFINTLVCEGCGDCGVQSNCVSIQPVETEFGRKRMIDQSSCNKDYSCLEGFCPALVTVHGGQLKKSAAVVHADSMAEIPEPKMPPLNRTQALLITGVGGTGVVTIGQIIGMAAHVDGLGVGLIDMAGLAQKGGAVTIHMKIAPRQSDIHALRVAAEEADTVLACDIVVAGTQKALAAIKPGQGQVYVNVHETFPGDFTRDPDFEIPGQALKDAISIRCGNGRAHFIDAQLLATALTGDGIATNMFMVGYAWQQGGIPVSRDGLLQAIALNGVAVELNRSAFEWGRRAAVDLAGVEKAAGLGASDLEAADFDIDAVIARRAEFLTLYQDRAYGERYRNRVLQILAAERAVVPDSSALAEAAARGLFKLMAIKDEYEVARLFASPAFKQDLARTFQDYESVSYHMAPPFLARRDGATGRLKKSTFGPWFKGVLAGLARFKFLRGTPLDPFGWLAERRWERELLSDYDAQLDEIVQWLSPVNHSIAVNLAAYPDLIRGYGHVKRASAAAAGTPRRELQKAFLQAREASLPQAAE